MTQSAKSTGRLKTVAQVRAEFDAKGISIAEWARTHGIGQQLVYQILSAGRPCRRGNSHRAAVLLGLKHGELASNVSEMNVVPARGIARKAA